jgi:hypothetical protein
LELGSFVVMKNSTFKRDFVKFKFLGFNIKESSRRKVCTLLLPALVYTEHLYMFVSLSISIFKSLVPV